MSRRPARANPYVPTWTLVTGSTYSAPVPSIVVAPGTSAVAFIPMKLFVDGATSQTTPLLPVPNARGAYSSSSTYSFLDLTTYVDAQNNNYTLVRGYTPTTGVLPGKGPHSAWVNIYTANTTYTGQTFSTTNSGLANVEATAGSWYSDGSKVYVHLSDGSNPTSHTFEATVRPYGILLQSVNHVTVQGITFEHQQKAGIEAVAYTSSNAGGSYFSNEYNQFLSNSIWNVGDFTTDNLPLQTSAIGESEGGIVIRADGNSVLAQ